MKQLGVVFQLFQMREDLRRGTDVDETPKPGESPSDYVLRIARTKAETAAHYIQRRTFSQRWPALAADTTVVLEGRIIGKPLTTDEAQRTLAELAGRKHEVITAVAIAFNGRVESTTSTSSVWFGELSAHYIKRYVALGESLDKAGAYSIQGRAAAFVTRIEGSYSGIMGLPLAETADLLARSGNEVL